MQWFEHAILHYADFKGRTGKADILFFLSGGLFFTLQLLGLSFFFILLFLLGVNLPFRIDSQEGNIVMTVVFCMEYAARMMVIEAVCFAIVLFIPGISMSVRRLHDQGLPGSWLWLALVPVVGAAWYVIMICNRGNTGVNRYGKALAADHGQSPRPVLWGEIALRYYARAIARVFRFRGRAGRKEYWVFHGISLAVGALITGLAFWSGESSDFKGWLFDTLSILTYISGPYIWFFGLSLSIRRLHDQGHRGFWYLLSFIPFAGGIWMFLLMTAQGTSGPNRYGEAPVDLSIRRPVKRPKESESIPATVNARANTKPRADNKIAYTSPAVEIRELRLSKTAAAPDEPVEAELHYVNTSAEPVRHTLVLYINGVAMRKEAVDIQPYGEGTAILQVPPRRDPGDYLVKAGACAQVITIK